MNNQNIKKAYLAAGCFWGVEYHFAKLSGVISAVSGYMGGNMPNPSYEMACTGFSGHLEVVEVSYDENIVSYESILKLFFEIHNFTQTNGQGPDIGPQYLSAIFYANEDEKETCEKVIKVLEDKGFKVATSLYEMVPFYEAEDYHQDYYERHQKVPYCHSYRKIF